MILSSPVLNDPVAGLPARHGRQPWRLDFPIAVALLSDIDCRRKDSVDEKHNQRAG